MPSIQRMPGALTFRPVSGGRLRCNQRPDLPPMSAKQAESLRKGATNNIRTKAPKWKDNSGKKPLEITAKVYADTAKCPFCGFEQRFSIGGMNYCLNCRGPFYVKQDRRLDYYD